MTDKNFVVKHALVANDGIGIGTLNPVGSFDASAMTDAMLIPQGTTGQRPSGANGMFRFNTTIGEFEGYSASLGGWSQITLVGSSVDAQFLASQPASYYLDANNTTGIIKSVNFDNSSHGARTGGTLHAAANSSANGFMSSSDKVAFDLIPVGGQIYANRALLSNTSNLNTIVAPGVYSCNTPADAATARNFPVTGSGGVLTVATNPAGNHVYQTYYERAAGNIAYWKRNSTDTGATWPAWNRLWDNVNLTDSVILTLIKTVDGTGSGLDADLLDGQEGSYYANASNMSSGTLPNARLSGSYTGLTSLTGSGVATFDYFVAGSGTAANPTITFGADDNTGLYRAADDTIGFSTNGTVAATLNSTGNFTAVGAITGASFSSSGAATFGGAMTANGVVKSSGTFQSSVGTTILGGTGAGSVVLRPNGIASTTGQYTIDASGNFYGTAGFIRAVGVVYAGNGSSYLGGDGNVVGSIWNNFGAPDAYSAIANRIESRANAFAASYQNGSVTSSRMAGYVEFNHTSGSAGQSATYAGYVMTMSRRISGDQYLFGFRQPQLYIANVGWFAAFNF